MKRSLVVLVGLFVASCGGGGGATNGHDAGPQADGRAGSAGSSASAGTTGAAGTGAGSSTGEAGVTGAAGTGVPGGAGTSGAAGGAGSGGAQPTWTVLVYANGDNNLGPTLFVDITEMVTATLGPATNVLVYADYPAEQLVPGRTDHFRTGSQLLRVKGNGMLESVKTTATEEDFDDPAVLTGAVKDVFTSYPADRHGLILWDHGGAWRSGFGGDQQNGTRDPQGMAFQATAQAIRAGLTAAKITASPALDFLSFDTCLLGSPEIASAFVDLTKVFIANAEIDYGAGWDYTKTLTWLSAHPAATAADFARQEVSFWQAHHNTNPVDVLFRSHVALEMSALKPFETSMGALVAAAQANAGAVSVARAFDLSLPDYYVENIGEGTAPVPLKDVGQILTSLTKSQVPQVATAATAANTALGSLVIARANGAARTGQSALNLGAGIPIEFTPALSASYRTLVTSWNTATKWIDLIDFVRGAADQAGPVITSTGLVGRKVPFQIADADLLSAEFTLWDVEPSRLYMLQLLNRGYVGPGAYEFTWGGTALAIDATPNPVLITLLPWREVASGGGSAPIFKAVGYVQADGDSLYTELLIDSATNTADVALVYLDGLPSVFPISALSSPGTVFRPLFIYVDTTDGKAYVEEGPTAVTFNGDSVSFVDAGLTGGSYSFSLQAKDTWGNATERFFDFTLP